nr:hypothetical protein [Tanacetum cinerariifolium]
MSNTNNNIQTQTSNTLHNAIMEAGSKDRPPMLAPCNYVQWKSRIKRYIDTKPNHELIHYCLKNPPYKLDWQDIKVPDVDGSIPCPSKTKSVTDGATVAKENPNYPIWVSNDAHVYVPHSTSREYTLKTQLLRIEMHSDETFDAYLNRAQEYADPLAAIDEPVKDKDIVMLVVSSLHEEYNGLKTTITARQSPTVFSELHALLSDHDYMLGKTRAPAPSITSSFATNYAIDSPIMPEALYGACNRCGIGHIPSQCPNRDPFTIHTRPFANFANTHAQSSNTSANWHSHTGANSHVTPDLEAMDNSEAYYGNDALHVGNGKGLPILHIGSSKVYSPQKTFSFKNIPHVPEISHNLLSVQNIFHDNDVFFEFHTSYFVVKDESTHTNLLTRPNKHGLYTITLPQLKSINKVSFSASIFTRSPILSPSSVSYLSPTSPDSFNGQPSPISTTSIPTPPPPPPIITRQRPANLRQNPKQRIPYTPFVNHATVLPTTITKPTSFTVANNSPEWRQAMKEQYDALMKNKTWSLVPHAFNTNVVDGKWVYRLKQDKNGAITRYKARFIVKGFRQQPCIDFHETFSPVFKSTTIRAVLSLAVTNDWPLHQLDIQNAFLHGNLKEQVYMKQPLGFIDPQRSNHVCLLHKHLYGLKQASHACPSSPRSPILSPSSVSYLSPTSPESFNGQPSPILTTSIPTPPPPTPPPPSPLITRQCPANLRQNPKQRIPYTPFANHATVLPTTITKPTSFTVANNSPEWRQAMKEQYDALMKNKTWSLVPHAFITNVVDGKWVYRLKHDKNGAITRYKARFVVKGNNRGTIDNIICQLGSAFALKDLGPLNYFLGIEIVSHVSDILISQKKYILELLQSVVKYRQVVGSLQYVTLSRHDIAFAVSKLNMVGDSDDRRSTGRFAIYLGSNLISWTARKQRTVSRSSTKAEYKALADTIVELTWLQALLNELEIRSSSTHILWCDNLGATYLSANLIFHARTKHVEIDYHFVREKIAQGDLRVQHISTHDQIADIFTKPLLTSRFLFLRSKLQVVAHP